MHPVFKHSSFHASISPRFLAICTSYSHKLATSLHSGLAFLASSLLPSQLASSLLPSQLASSLLPPYQPLLQSWQASCKLASKLVSVSANLQSASQLLLLCQRASGLLASQQLLLLSQPATDLLASHQFPSLCWLAFGLLVSVTILLCCPVPQRLCRYQTFQGQSTPAPGSPSAPQLTPCSWFSIDSLSSPCSC